MAVMAVDFDGTLFEKKKFPEYGKPKLQVIDFVKKFGREDGNKIILWTCRTGKDLSDAVAACRRYGLTFDAVNENLQEKIEPFVSDTRKIFADIYLDDCAITPADLSKPGDIYEKIYENINRKLIKDKTLTLTRKKLFEIASDAVREDYDECLRMARFFPIL